ncbi:MAG: DUF2085 domain-containing protein [Anaerolineae bacterium]|nr:DUF2085 domain-containing protein [Anaerolineae bacterium]
MSKQKEVDRKLQQQRNTLIRRNLRYARWQRHWAEIAVVLLTVYVLLPILAPTLMKVGATAPARVIYTVYSPLCHQFAFRSIFLYGDQTFYPRDQAADGFDRSFDKYAADSDEFVDIYTSYRRDNLGSRYQFGGSEELAVWTPELQRAARQFKGDEIMGYKTALCARDMAIYAAMAVGAFGFLFVRKKLRPVPIVLYVLLGLGPIGIDGFSQLLGYPPFELWPPRETIPEFRVLTGALFGLMNVWLAFPYLEKSMMESASAMELTIQEMLAGD